MKFFTLYILVFTSLLSASSMAQSNQNVIHLGVQFGKFYSSANNVSTDLNMHTGSAPLMLGYDYYPTPKFGFRFTGYYSKLGDYGVMNSIDIFPSTGGELSRNTEVMGLKYSAKYWFIDFEDEYYNLGFETGFGAINHKIYTSYPTTNIFQNEEVEYNQLLFPIHVGVNAILFNYFEMGINYNFYPSLGSINNDYTSSISGLTFQNPTMRSGFLSVSLRTYFSW